MDIHNKLNGVTHIRFAGRGGSGSTLYGKDLKG